MNDKLSILCSVLTWWQTIGVFLLWLTIICHQILHIKNEQFLSLAYCSIIIMLQLNWQNLQGLFCINTDGNFSRSFSKIFKKSLFASNKGSPMLCNGAESKGRRFLSKRVRRITPLYENMLKRHCMKKWFIQCSVFPFTLYENFLNFRCIWMKNELECELYIRK